MKEREKEFNKVATLKNLQDLFSQKTNPDSIKKIKEFSNLLIKHKNEDELVYLLDENFKEENIKNYNPHLLTVVSSIYSEISHRIGLAYNLQVIENLKEIPNGIVSNLFRNARHLNYYDLVDEILKKNPEFLERRDINILYEFIFYYDFKGDILNVKNILNQIETKYRNSIPIMQSLRNLYLKYGTEEDVNRITSILNIRPINTVTKEKKLTRLIHHFSMHGNMDIENDLQEYVINDLLEKMRLYEQKAKQTILSEMVNGISHEFGQPITNIKFLIQYNQKMLQDTVNKEEVLKIFSSILEDIERLSHLVKTIAPITSSKPVIESFNILDRINRIFELAKPRLLENKISHKIISTETSLLVHQDPVRFEQIINNLLLNSIDSLSEKKSSDRWIEIQISSQKKNVQIDFKDNGVGIPDSKRKNIFIPFYTTKLKGKGEGLGLYIVWNLLKMMDGTIYLDYSYNRGACFKIEIPLQPKGESV